MGDQEVASRTRVKDKVKSSEVLKDDLHLKKEVGKLSVVLLYVLGIIIGGLSLSAMVSGILSITSP